MSQVSSGDIVLAPLAQADGDAKLRPVLLLQVLPGFGDFLVCGISTQVRQAIAGFDLVLRPGSSEFAKAGLLAESVVRLGFLGVVPIVNMRRRLGRLPLEMLSQLRRRLAKHIDPGSADEEIED